MASSSSGSSSNNAAMSLWNKFSDLQQQAEHCRQQRSSARQSMDVLRASVEKIQQTVVSERQLTNENKEKASRLHEQLTCTKRRLDDGGRVLFPDDDDKKHPSLILELEETEKRYSEAVTACENSKHQLEQWKSWKVDQLQQQKQSNFRHQCCEWRLQAAAAGLSHAVAVAARKAAGATSEDVEELEVESNLSDAAAEINENDDPTSWILGNDDHELKDAMEEYSNSRRLHDSTVTKLEVWKTKHAALEAKRQNRLDRQEQLNKQLQRLSNDCTNLQNETSQMKLLIEEDSVLAATYRTSMLSVVLLSRDIVCSRALNFRNRNQPASEPSMHNASQRPSNRGPEPSHTVTPPHSLHRQHSTTYSTDCRKSTHQQCSLDGNPKPLCVNFKQARSITNHSGVFLIGSEC